MKRRFIIGLLFCLSITLYQGNAGAVVGIPDVTQAATLIVPLMEKGVSSAHNTLTVVNDFCSGVQIIHWQVWDIDGNAMTGLSGNVTLGDGKQWVSDFGAILAGASGSQLSQLTDGSFYHGFMTMDMVTASTSLLPTNDAYPFSPWNCLTGQAYYVRLTEGAANGIPMVHIEGGVNTSLSGLGTATGFYQVGDDREEIDASGRHYAYTSSNGLPSAFDPNDKIDRILSRVYGAGNGESRIVVWTWTPAFLGPTVAPSDVGGPFGFVIRSEAGAVTTNTTVPLNHVVNVINVPGDTNGTAWIFDVPGGFETYAFSFNSANNVANPALTWEVMFESTIIHEWLPSKDGVCGTTLNSCTSGALQDIADSSTQYLWNCTGSNGGSTAYNCSAPIQSAGSVDLTMPSFSGPSASSNGQAFKVTLTIRNNGTGAAGPFKVKVYFSNSTSTAGTGVQVLGTQDVAGLAAGQSMSLTFDNLVVYGGMVHNYYYLLGVVDADNVVVETNESNNLNGRSFGIL